MHVSYEALKLKIKTLNRTGCDSGNMKLMVKVMIMRQQILVFIESQLYARFSTWRFIYILHPQNNFTREVP